MERTLVVIPARWKSERFPGKPIVPLLGVPMIVRVWRRVMMANLVDECVLATDDERIAEVCRDYDIDYVMTSENCRTGTDRVAEVARKRRADIYVNVQGDEPLLEPEGVDEIIRAHVGFVERGIEVTNTYVPEDSLPFEDESVHVYLTKTVDDRVLGLSRSPIPYFFGIEVVRNSHVGMYAFTQGALSKFAELEKGPIESAESIEMLRYLEHNIPIGCIPIKAGSKSVDNPEDVAEVERILRDIVGEKME